MLSTILKKKKIRTFYDQWDVGITLSNISAKSGENI